MKRIALLVCVLLCMAVSAYAGEMTYSGTLTNNIVIKQPGEHTIILAGATFNGYVTIDEGDMGSYEEAARAIHVKSPAEKLTIILQDGTTNTLKGGDEYGGIIGDAGTEIVIRCQSAGEGHVCTENCGKLKVVSDGDEVAIGISGSGEIKITIMGGNITATSRNNAAIGSHTTFNGTVTITGGNVTAEGRVGIGGNNDFISDASVAIRGGTVAIRGEDAGIGSNTRFDGTVTVDDGNVTIEPISGVTAIGIGAPQHFNGDVIINGGTVNISAGQYAAGIGNRGGDSLTGENIFGFAGSVTINGGTVTVAGGDYAPGIGSAENNNMTGSVTINGGTVLVTGGQDASGIGTGGRKGTAWGNMSGKVTVRDGDVTVIAGLIPYEGVAVGYAPAIGAGYLGGTDGMTIEAYPFPGKTIGAKSGFDAEDAVNLDGVPYSEKTDIIPLFHGDRYLRFRYDADSATPAPVTPAPVTPAPVTPAPVTPAPTTPTPAPAVPDVPQTGDGMNFAFLAALAAIGMIGMTVILRKKNKA